jgi:CHAD domain-containing protein
MTLVETDLEQQAQLEEISQNHPKAYLRRVACVILLYNQGLPTREVSRQTGISLSQARHWRHRFAVQGMAIFPSPSRGDTLDKIVMENGITSQKGMADRRPTGASIRKEKAVPNQPTSVSKPEPNEMWAALTTQKISHMAKAKNTGITPRETFAEAARKVLLFHFIQMLAHEEGTQRGEDIEELHDMRVATRRMRAAFEVFEGAFQNKAIKNHLKGLKATGHGLGSVRDLDVFIEKANAYLADRPESDREELYPLIATWENEREKHRQEMLEYLVSPRYQSFKEKFFIFLNSPGEGVRPKPADQFTSWLVCEIVPVLIYTRLAAVRSFEPLVNSASLDQLHSLRIEFKKLRYTLEFFREVLGDEAGVVIDVLKTIQDHLGDLHDAQVATQILRDFLSQWDAQQNSLPVEMRQSPDPIINYLSSRYSERQRLMTSFREVWENFNRPELRYNLALAVAKL